MLLKPPFLNLTRAAVCRTVWPVSLCIVPSHPCERLSSHRRCAIAPSYAAKLVAVMRELQRRRQSSNVFAGTRLCNACDVVRLLGHSGATCDYALSLARVSCKTPGPARVMPCNAVCTTALPQRLRAPARATPLPNRVSVTSAGKHGFITPRDLFRWAERGAVGYQELAENGYMVLGERLRSDEERSVVREVLEKIMKVRGWFFLLKALMRASRSCCEGHGFTYPQGTGNE